MQPVAVVTGASSGIGAATAAQLAGAGYHVVLAARRADRLEEAAARARERGGSTQTALLDVTDTAAVAAFAHSLDRCDVLVNNAGGAIGMEDVGDADPADWQTMFEVNVLGSLHLTKALLPLLIASGDGVLVNTGSAAGFWPTAGAGQPITAYSTANFAIRGFSEALIEDLRCNAPQVRVVVVMPGLVNTDIAENSRRALGLPEYEQLSDAQLLELLPEETRTILVAMGLLPENFSADDLRRAIPRLKNEFQDKGFTAAQAATVILDGVRSGAWRILVGDEAKMLDEQVRANPQAPFDYENYAEMYGPLIAQAQAEAPEAP